MPQVATYLARRSYPLDPAEVEDLVAEVLQVTWRRLDDVPAGAEVAWMIGVARNLVNNARRKRGRRKAAEAKLRPRGDSPSAEDEMIANDQLRQALGMVHAGEREILLLHYWDGLGTDDLAVVFEITPGAAATRLSRASQRLRDVYAGISETGDTNDPVRTSKG
jgi:RNA polymerase sigma-70 factor (ECF subfamily)